MDVISAIGGGRDDKSAEPASGGKAGVPDFTPPRSLGFGPSDTVSFSDEARRLFDHGATERGSSPVKGLKEMLRSLPSAPSGGARGWLPSPLRSSTSPAAPRRTAAPSETPPTAPRKAADGTWSSPLDHYTVSQEFGQTEYAAGGAYGGKPHTGIDLAAPAGSEIHAANDGRVIGSGYDGERGNWVELDHGDGRTTRYYHMQQAGPPVGTTVSGGQAIGKVGSTGQSTGPHLHFEYRENGTPVDPRSVLDL